MRALRTRARLTWSIVKVNEWLDVLWACGTLVVAFFLGRFAWLALVPAVASAVWLWPAIVTPRASKLQRALARIETPRLVFGRPEPGDADAVAATMDPVVVEANGMSARSIQQTIDDLGRPAKSTGRAAVLMTDKDSGQVLGMVTCVGLPAARPLATVGWWLGPWGRGLGYGIESLAAVFDALHRARVPVVLIQTKEDNFAVRRIVERLGAIEIERASHTLPDGSVVDSISYLHATVPFRVKGAAPTQPT
jgi:RimJ/RimL family protein N-acetyltransferase